MTESLPGWQQKDSMPRMCHRALFTYANLTRIAELGRRHRILTLGDHPIFAKNGFLLTYGEDPTRTVERAAEYVDKLFRGSRPGDLPIEQPRLLSWLSI